MPSLLLSLEADRQTDRQTQSFAQREKMENLISSSSKLVALRHNGMKSRPISNRTYNMWRPSASITCLAWLASAQPSSAFFAAPPRRARRQSRTPALRALAPSLDDVAAIASIVRPMTAFDNVVDSAALFSSSSSSSSSFLDAAAASPTPGGIFDAGSIKTAFSVATFFPQLPWLLLILLPRADVTKKLLGGYGEGGGRSFIYF